MGVTGCMAQRLGPQLLQKARHVSLVVGPDGYRALPALVEGARRGERAIATTFDPRSTTRISPRAGSTR
jgi:tRNA-2-methylthio-N6-dimethylallyladenosine synthase